MIRKFLLLTTTFAMLGLACLPCSNSGAQP